MSDPYAVLRTWAGNAYPIHPVLTSPAIAEAVRALLAERDALVTGCCTSCGRTPTVENNTVNGLPCSRVTPSCDCHAPLHLWPSTYFRAATAPEGQPS